MGKGYNSHSIYGTWGPAHKSTRSRLAPPPVFDKDGNEVAEKQDRRKPFGDDFHDDTPGPYESERCYSHLSNQLHFPCAKFSSGPKFENAQKRFYSWAHLEHSNKGEFSPGPIYKIQSDFEQEELPPRPKHITKRQCAPWQREECPGEPGCHYTAWGDDRPEKPFHNPLFPYKNAHAESDRIPFDKDMSTMYLHKSKSGAEALMQQTAQSSRRSVAISGASPSFNAELMQALRVGLEDDKKKSKGSKKGLGSSASASGLSGSIAINVFQDMNSEAMGMPTHSASRLSLTLSPSGQGRKSHDGASALDEDEIPDFTNKKLRIKSKVGPGITGFTTVGAKKKLRESRNLERRIRAQKNRHKGRGGRGRFTIDPSSPVKGAWNASTNMSNNRATYFFVNTSTIKST